MVEDDLIIVWTQALTNPWIGWLITTFRPSDGGKVLDCFNLIFLGPFTFGCIQNKVLDAVIIAQGSLRPLKC